MSLDNSEEIWYNIRHGRVVAILRVIQGDTRTEGAQWHAFCWTGHRRARMRSRNILARKKITYKRSFEKTNPICCNANPNIMLQHICRNTLCQSQLEYNPQKQHRSILRSIVGGCNPEAACRTQINSARSAIRLRQRLRRTSPLSALRSEFRVLHSAFALTLALGSTFRNNTALAADRAGVAQW